VNDEPIACNVKFLSKKHVRLDPDLYSLVGKENAKDNQKGSFQFGNIYKEKCRTTSEEIIRWSQFEITLASTGSASSLGVKNQLPELVEGSDSEITKVKLGHHE
jgi:hypothetical protein